MLSRQWFSIESIQEHLLQAYQYRFRPGADGNVSNPNENIDDTGTETPIGVLMLSLCFGIVGWLGWAAGCAAKSDRVRSTQL